MKKFDFDALEPAEKTAFYDLQAQRDALLASLKELLPYAERFLLNLNEQMVGSLYPSINLAKINRAKEAIAKTEAA